LVDVEPPLNFFLSVREEVHHLDNKREEAGK
jgi:hypothetical protein